MTASFVRGLAVIVDEPTEAPMRDRAGGRVMWTQTRTLLLEDGTTTYGCVHCDYTSDNVNSIRPHLKVHSAKERRPRTGPVDVSAMTLTEIGKRLAQVDRLIAERDEWKRRALAAEKSLKALREALRDVANP